VPPLADVALVPPAEAGALVLVLELLEQAASAAAAVMAVMVSSAVRALRVICTVIPL